MVSLFAGALWQPLIGWTHGGSDHIAEGTAPMVNVAAELPAETDAPAPLGDRPRSA